jgi:eukaryotic-like serine/threonine-protein kinase
VSEKRVSTERGEGGPEATEGPGAPSALPERYEDVGLIGRGGMGEVRRVRDRVLNRVVAMKVLRWEYIASKRVRARFTAEAEVTAGLQHPGIVAVHDRGELADGRLWFTMKEVRGRTLGDVIDEVHAASGPAGFEAGPSGWTFRRLVDAFARIAQAVAYAHQQRVVHRDLKPDNLMVGELGEVLVMDWGIARRDRERDAGAAIDPEGEAVIPSGPVAVDGMTMEGSALGEAMTVEGTPLGTPAYMPPEQARGELELHGPASDVYSLGAILYQLLAGKPPYQGGSAIWQVRNGPPAPLAEAVKGGPPVPPELVQIAARAMERAIGDRYPSAEVLAAEVLTWLDGARRRDQGLSILEQARALEPQIAHLRALAAKAQAEARAALAPLKPFDPVEKKRPGWALEGEAARLSREAALVETRWLETVHGALSQDPHLPEAHAALADHYRERLRVAEEARQDEEAARCEVLLEAHDRGRHAAFLRGEAKLSLVTDPPGAEVRLHRYTPIDHRLVPEPAGVLGKTPLDGVQLSRGSYLLTIHAEGRAEVRYPVSLERAGRWDGRAPGEDAPRPIVLPREDELGPDDVYVPAGYAWTGGDPAAGDSLPRRQIWIDAFVIRRYPVTNREYLEFLNDLVAAGREKQALDLAPPSVADPRGTTRPTLERDAGGRFVLGKEGAWDGAWDLDYPVLRVDWHGAVAYARWLAERAGQPWRLLNELEREKAARGADGRMFPWSDEPEPGFTRVSESFAAPPRQARVDEPTLDESPYGVRWLAGNARDWCNNRWRREGPAVEDGRLILDPARDDDPDYRAVRGGAWGSPMQNGRAAMRFGALPAFRHLNTGLRVGRSIGR